MSFHEALFPPAIAWGATGGPKFKTAVYTADSGYEALTLDWQSVRGEWEISHTLKSPLAIKEITEFFYARRGMAYGFRFKDWNDYKIKQETIAVGDFGSTEFQVTKTYRNLVEGGEPFTYVRNLTKLAWNTMAGVTVGGQLAFRSTDPAWADVSPASPAYQLDETTGVMILREAPNGRRYDGTTPAAAYTYEGAGTLTSVLTPNTGAIPVAFVDAGHMYLKGGGAGAITGLRRVRLSDGVEDLQVTSATIGFPETDPTYDDQQIAGITACHDGYIYVTVGGFNTQVLYKVSLTDFSIAAAYGTGAGGLPGDGNVGPTQAPGSVSADGARVINMSQLGGVFSCSVHLTSDLTMVRQPNLGTIPISNNPFKGACPLYDTNFAILLSWSDTVRIELWDDASHKLLQIDDMIGDWLVWDETAGDRGVVIGFHEADGSAWACKYSENTQKEAWRIRLPGPAVRINPQSPCAGKLVFNTTGSPGVVCHLDTLTGELLTRALAVNDVTSAQYYDATNTRIATAPITSQVSRVLDVDVAGVTILDADALIIGYCEFHVPVRFDTDHLDITQDHYQVSSWGSIPLVEVRDWSEVPIV